MNPAPANEQASYRYPGVTPFTTEQAPVFFGRKQDTDELYRLIRRESLVVLYGKSGLGKSSLLNAGIIPRCKTESSYNPLLIRFGAWIEGTTATPLNITKTALSIGYEQSTFLDSLLPDDTSMWYRAKTLQLNAQESQVGGRPLLLFDQFEELFSYPSEQVQAFQEELSELLNTSVPLRFQRMAESSDSLTESEEDLLETPLEARIVFAIRSDRMHLLDRLKDYLPNVLRHCFELQALNPKDAEEAIQLPAQAVGNFITSPFSYSPAAMQKLLDFLTDHQDGRVEGILLQMLCEHYERQLVQKQGLTKLTTKEVGFPEEVVEKYYEEKINGLPESQRLPARKLIEDGLVSEREAMRLSLHESYILHEFGVDKALLEQLVDSRLLRSEPFLRGGYTFELSHDRLVGPVVEARRLRIERERQEKEEAERKIAQENRILKAKAAQVEVEKALRKQAEQAKDDADNQRNIAKMNELRAKRRTTFALLFSLLAFCSTSIAIYFYHEASIAEKVAMGQRIIAERALFHFKEEEKSRKNLEIKGLVEDVRVFIKAEDYRIAENKIQEILSLDSSNVEALTLLKQIKEANVDIHPAAPPPNMPISSSNTCEKFIRKGDKDFEQGNYESALNQYNAAKACDPAQQNLVDKKISSLFNKIELSRKRAELEKNK